MIHPGETASEWPGVVKELHAAPDPQDAFMRLAGLPHCVFFDSALRDPQLGRYSFIAADPFAMTVTAADEQAGWDNLATGLSNFSAPSLPDLPPFQGGAAGLFAYDLAHSLERLPRTRFDEFQTPGMAIGWYDIVVAFDHARQTVWIISQGFPELDSANRRRRAE